MEESEFQQARMELNQCPCPYEKAILSGRCGCHYSQRLSIAEREMMSCVSIKSKQRCSTLLTLFYQKSRFALKQVDLEQQHSHNQMMKVQCGGLYGLQLILFPKQANTFNIIQVQDIDILIENALTTYFSIKQFPYQELLKFIRNYQVRVKKIR
ncbi:MAG: hypothetical protein KAH84_02635 [Thiomargarita sp.]|nr:hypothetical protein [Thiomargarita sp.]